MVVGTVVVGAGVGGGAIVAVVVVVVSGSLTAVPAVPPVLAGADVSPVDGDTLGADTGASAAPDDEHPTTMRAAQAMASSRLTRC